tara:strand:+ start:245 stop:502 length:258 start_codon:yes stop_codon:yes gene_type:complete
MITLLKKYKGLVFIIVLSLVVIYLYMNRTEYFGTTPAHFIQMRATDAQDNRIIGGLRVGASCGIVRPTQRGYPIANCAQKIGRYP